MEKLKRLAVSLLFIMLPAATPPLTGYAQATDSSYRQTVRTFHDRSGFDRETGGELSIGRAKSVRFRNGELSIASRGLIFKGPGGDPSVFPQDRQLPQNELTVLAVSGETVYIGGKRGLIIHDAREGSIRYLAGMRWLPDDHVTGLAIEGDGIWVETPKGFGRIRFQPMTLEEKSRTFVERIRARHVRHGLTADSRLTVPGDLSTNQMVSSDNDGLWTAMYAAAECFRYRVTGQRDALDNARQSMEAIMRLESITGIPGFHARSFIKIGEDLQPRDGEWHNTPDGQWRWKADTSSDEIVGHYFIYPIYYDLIATQEEKIRIRGVITRMTDHILDNNYQLIDVDGKRTRWGWWGPDVIWEDPDETGLRALHILAHLKVAHHITGNERYSRAYQELITQHKYHLLTRNQKIMVPGHINHSDDELAFLSYYPLLMYEKDPGLLEVYRTSLERSWEIERPERNPLWNFIYAVGSGKAEYDAEASMRTLREIPLDQVEWTVTNSHRLDVTIDPMSDRFGRKQSLVVLPYDELPMSKWNGNPYRLDGGSDGRSEDDGAYFLLPYWMGRHHKLIR